MPPVVFVNARCLDGDLRVKEGFNISVRQEDNTNSLIIGAAIGAGAGLACSEIPLYAGEVPPNGSGVLTGGPKCNEVVKTINGVGGPTLQLLAGRGVRITASLDDPHEIVVSLAENDLAICVPES